MLIARQGLDLLTDWLKFLLLLTGATAATASAVVFWVAVSDADAPRALLIAGTVAVSGLSAVIAATPYLVTVATLNLLREIADTSQQDANPG